MSSDSRDVSTYIQTYMHTCIHVLQYRTVDVATYTHTYKFIRILSPQTVDVATYTHTCIRTYIHTYKLRVSNSHSQSIVTRLRLCGNCMATYTHTYKVIRILSPQTVDVATHIHTYIHTYKVIRVNIHAGCRIFTVEVLSPGFVAA